MRFRLDRYEEESKKEMPEEERQIHIKIHQARTKAQSYMKRVQAMLKHGTDFYLFDSSNFDMGSYQTAIGQTLSLLQELLQFYTDGFIDEHYITERVKTIVSALKNCDIYNQEGET